jgi:hypothetical protein
MTFHSDVKTITAAKKWLLAWICEWKEMIFHSDVKTVSAAKKWLFPWILMKRNDFSFRCKNFLKN